ncbi:MAG: radical SAM protein [Candidatus Bathyarchaeota archaeon]
MKILLLNPPYSYPEKSFSFSDFSAIPLGLLYIATVLEQEGYNVQILDSLSMNVKTRISKSCEQIHVGASWQQIEAELQRLKPDVVGITNPYSVQISNAITASEIVKRISPKILTVVGGPHASIRPLDFFERTKSIDIVAMGEGEYIMPQIIHYVEGKTELATIDGIAYQENGQAKVNPRGTFIKDLDQLPFPSYHLLDIEKHFDLMRSGYLGRSFVKTDSAIPLVTSRGCPFNCVFCSIHLHMGRKWRAHSSSYVLNHLEHIVKNLTIKHVSFVDDNLTLNSKRFEEILDGIVEKDLNITWNTPNGVRADTLNRKILLKAKKAGCVSLVIGVESGDQEILGKVIHKSLDLSKVVEVCRICKEIDLPLSAFFVIGLPGERKENIERTLVFARMLNKKFDVMPIISFAMPYYGTALYRICKEGNYLINEPTPENIIVSDEHGKFFIGTPDFTPEEVRACYKKFYRKLILTQLTKPIYYLKIFSKNPKILFTHMKRILKKMMTEGT